MGLTTTETDRVASGSVVFIDDRELKIVRSSPHKHRFIVHFDGVETREEADAIAGRVLRAEHLDAGDPSDDDEVFWIHELIGARVVGIDGQNHGKVVAVQENPASDLLVLEDDSLVPLVFVVGWIDRPDALRIDPPPGLFEPGQP